MLPQNVALWHKDYFELKAIKKLQENTHKKTLSSPYLAKKQGMFPFVKVT